MTGTASAPLVADCPNCAGFQADERHRGRAFRMSDGVTHCVPDMWIAGREARYPDLDALAAFARALIDWAEHCRLIEAARLHPPTESVPANEPLAVAAVSGVPESRSIPSGSGTSPCRVRA